METQSKTNIDGVQANVNRGVGYEDPNAKAVRSIDLILRLVAAVATLIAAAVLGSAKQTKDFLLPSADLTTTLLVSATAKSHYSSAYVYFVVVNAIACVYSVFSLVIAFTRISKPASKVGFAFVLSLLDLIMVVLLSTGNGAAAAIGIVAQKGNSHAGWGKICNAYGKFCGQITAGIVISMFALVIYLFLVILYVLNLSRRSH